MKIKLTLLNVIIFSIVATGFIECDGDQGDVGPKGDPGATGNTGMNGTGFNELTQYGNIELTLSGTRPEGIALNETINFIYMPTSGILDNSSVYTFDDNSVEFNIGRENKGKIAEVGRTSMGGYKNNLWMSLERNAEGVFYFNQFVIHGDIVTDDFKTIELSYSSSSSNETFNMEVTNYSYTAATGSLIFDFSYTIPAVNNNTGNDLNITGEVNVIVFENMNPMPI